MQNNIALHAESVSDEEVEKVYLDIEKSPMKIGKSNPTSIIRDLNMQR